MQSIRGKLSYANVVSSICLFLLLATGAAIGAGKLINGSKIKPHTITGRQVKKGSLGRSVFAGGLPKGPRGATGPRGFVGPAAGSFLSGGFGSSDGSSGYVPVDGHVNDPKATSDSVEILSPAHDIVARDLAVRENGRPPVATRVYTLVVNGANTALSCTISDANGLTACSDTSHAVLVPAGSGIALHFEASGSNGGASGEVLFGIATTTP